MGLCDDIRARLKAVCGAHYDKALRQDDPYGTRRFVRKGILAAETAIDSVHPTDDARAFLGALGSAVEKARDELRRDPDDEDGWGPGAANTILQEIEKERGAFPAPKD